MKKNMKKLFNPGPETVIEEGDMLSVIAETSVGRIVKKDGLIGWYKEQRGNIDDISVMEYKWIAKLPEKV